jgi:hypothetical protein
MWKKAIVAYLKHYPSISVEGIRKIKKIPSHGSQCHNQNSNQGLPKYKYGSVTAWGDLFVSYVCHGDLLSEGYNM